MKPLNVAGTLEGCDQGLNPEPPQKMEFDMFEVRWVEDTERGGFLRLGMVGEQRSSRRQVGEGMFVASAVMENYIDWKLQS